MQNLGNSFGISKNKEVKLVLHKNLVNFHAKLCVLYNFDEKLCILGNIKRATKIIFFVIAKFGSSLLIVLVSQCH